MDTAVAAASSLLTSSCAGLHESVDGGADCWACIPSTAPWVWTPYCTDSPSAEPRREERFLAPAGGLAVYTNTRPAPVLSLSFSLQNMRRDHFSPLPETYYETQMETTASQLSCTPAFTTPFVLFALIQIIYIFLCHQDHISVNLSMFAWTAVVCASHSCYLPIYATYSILLVLDLFSCPKHTAS